MMTKEQRAIYYKNWKLKHPGYFTEYDKKMRKAKRKEYNEYHKKYRFLNSLKEKARKIVFTGLRNGSILKKDCEICGISNTEAHHTDYKKPLEIKWLCKKHHTLEHEKAI